MRIHYLQHVPFEGLGSMEKFFLDHHCSITCTPFYQTEEVPQPSQFDLLIIMGGPMGVYDEVQYPWLKTEKKFIEQAINTDKPILGICLGAQLLATVLGAKVYPNKFREIGWFELIKSEQIKNSFLDAVLPKQFDVFHWHGDTFDLPAGAKLVGSSQACTNQGFVLNEKIIGFQFHLETTPESAQNLITHCQDELDNSTFVQTPEQILAPAEKFAQINKVMNLLLEKFILKT